MDGTDDRSQDNIGGDQTSVEAVDTTAELDGASLMEQFLSDPSHDYKTLKYGDVMEGIIMHLDRDELLVDIGSKAEGIVPAKEYSSLTAEEKDKLEVGENILVFVVQPENPEGHPVVSIDRARQEKSWRRLQELHEANEVIEAEVTNYNKGGLLVNLDGVRGFVPASQVSEIRGGDDASKQADMAKLIGTSLPLKVIEINRHRNRLILSERQAVQERRDVMKEKLIGELKEGEVRKGRVSSICDFGAFVDIGGADGLVHLSELSWSRVRHPSELLTIGEEVDVYVLGINSQEKKIALSIKRTQEEPWSRVTSQYQVGQIVRGRVTQVVNFGLFVRIEDGIEGLLHISEITDAHLTHPKQLFTEGDELIVRIIRIDPQRRRLALSLRRALDTPDDELVAVFGDDSILAERDALVTKIHEKLEAEGIPLTPPEERPEIEGESSDSSTEAAAESTPAEPELTAGEAQVAAFEERRQRAEASANQRPRRQRESRQSDSSSSTFGDDDQMSAMAMAFAMAGAGDDLLSDDAPVVQEPVAEAPTTEAKHEAATPAAESEASAEEAEAKPKNSKLPETGEGADWVSGDGTDNVPDGFPIKGNASSKIFHPEESGSYNNTIAEIYFSTPEAAESHGYRLPKVLQAAKDAAEAAGNAAEAALESAKSDEE